MNLCEPFIRRPVMTTLVMLTILVFGVSAYKNLSVSDLPDVDYPTIEVTVSYPGSSPETMASTCATPLEREFMTIEGLNSISSTSQIGQTQIVLQFTLEKSIESGGLDVESAINRAMPNLPKNLPYNPTYTNVNPSATPIYYMAIASDTMTLGDLYDYGNTYIGQRLSMIDGVSQVLTYGSPYAARVQIDPEEIAAKNVGLGDVALAVKKGNVDLPTGTLFGPKQEFTIDIAGQLFKADGYDALAIKAEDGSLVKVTQIGRTIDSLESDKYYLHYTSHEVDNQCVILAVRKQAGYNTVKVINQINQLLPNIQKSLPSSLIYYKVFDKADSIIAGIDDVKMTLIIAFILVVLIIYFTLGKLFNTIIPSLALPISVVGTFVVMYLLNYSLDTLSLLALTLSVGFLVDDAIVVLENNVRHVQLGAKPFEGTIKGSQEIGITILSMTTCLISVFIPLLFMEGIIGRIFREFAVTIVVAILFSGVVSLTLTPLLCSRFIPAYDPNKKKGLIERVSDKSNEIMLNGYKRGLEWVLHHKPLMLITAVLCIVASYMLFIIVPKGFLPDNDIGVIQCYTQARDGTSPFEMANYQERVGKTILKDPAVNNFISVGSVTTDNQGFLFLSLKPYKERGSIQSIINRLSKKLDTIPGINSYLSNIPLINLQVGLFSRAEYQYVLTSVHQELLNKYVPEMTKQMQGVKGLAQVSSDLEITQPQLQIEIQRDRASDLNLSAGGLEQYFSFAYSTNKVSTINTSINQYDVIVETLPKYYKNPSVINQLYLKSTNGNIVPLTEVIDYKEGVGPLTVNHFNGLPSSMISFNLNDLPLSKAMETIDVIQKDLLPTTISCEVQGTANVFQSSFANLSFLFIVMIFVIYVILGILYESFIHPLTVMSALPPTTFGGFFMLYIIKADLTIYSFVGIIMLIGIVMKNGIMMVDFANQKVKEENKSPHDAIYEACLIRFRPIIMTTISAFMGAVPIAMGIGGASAVSRIPLGIIVVGGLVLSQTLTLFLTPVVYYYLEVLQEKIKQKFMNKHKAKVSDT
jgi:hydrophobic/amphiphilic exporter-1 (mainly G- bacteria), HAE1 family